ncbi:MAG: copper resistance protein CopC, partial [Dehalococcoidia bacterium]
MKRGLVKSFLGLGFALTLVALALQSGPPAQAHALLVGSDPPVNARLIEPPERITAQFSEPLSPALSSIQVLDGSGERVDRDDISFNPDNSREMSVGLQAPLPPAFYTVVWETLSSIDGHLLKGSFPFTVLNPDGSEPTGPRLAGFGTGVSGGEPTADVVGTKWVILSASILLVGALAFVTGVVRPATASLGNEWKQMTRDATRRHLAWVAWPAVVMLAAGGGVELLLQARQLGGLGSLDDALDTFWGERWLQRQAVLATVGVALAFSLGLWRAQRPLLSEAALWVALAGGLGYLILLSMISHAGSVPGSFWAVAADFVHLIAAAVWIGMLVQLTLFLVWVHRHLPEESRLPALASHLQGFSILAATALILLLATGTFNAFAEVPTPEAMLDTAYGRVLTAKLALILPLLAVAGVNAIVLRRAGGERRTSGPGSAKASPDEAGRRGGRPGCLRLVDRSSAGPVPHLTTGSGGSGVRADQRRSGCGLRGGAGDRRCGSRHQHRPQYCGHQLL